MTVPFYLTGAVSYDQELGVVDVATMITKIVAMATALTPAWTNPSAGKIVSPPDASGRQMTLQFTRIAADNIEMTLTDGAGRTLTRRAEINPAGTTVDYYVGLRHMAMDWLNTASALNEGLIASVLDLSPEVQTAHDKWASGNGARDAADISDGFYDCESLFIPIRSTGLFSPLGRVIMHPLGKFENNGGTIGQCLSTRTPSGSNIWYPVLPIGDSLLNVFKIRGKASQMLLCDSHYFSAGNEIAVPIDEATTGLFRVTRVPTLDILTARLAIRKS